MSAASRAKPKPQAPARAAGVEILVRMNVTALMQGRYLLAKIPGLPNPVLVSTDAIVPG